jgi:hydroxymethylpyrimidine/phosphomethylpyrimidine kinase
MPANPLPRSRIPICLTIAGSDSGGGAGIQADLKTFSAMGVYGASVVTAVTAQNTRAVTAVAEMTPDMVAAQMQAVFDDLDVAAVKVGMLASVPLITVVARHLQGLRCPVVVDPVMVAKSGDALLQEGALPALRELLLPLATLLTPNLPEAARLLQAEPAATPAQVLEQGKALLAMGAAAVLMKGGHAEGDTCVDLLVTRDAPPLRLEAPRLPTRHTHGTGCTLSSAIAAELAKGRSLPQAFTQAHAYLQGAIRAAGQLQVGGGRGPVHHFHHWWG